MTWHVPQSTGRWSYVKILIILLCVLNVCAKNTSTKGDKISKEDKYFLSSLAGGAIPIPRNSDTNNESDNQLNDDQLVDDVSTDTDNETVTQLLSITEDMFWLNGTDLANETYADVEPSVRHKTSANEQGGLTTTDTPTSTTTLLQYQAPTSTMVPQLVQESCDQFVRIYDYLPTEDCPKLGVFTGADHGQQRNGVVSKEECTQACLADARCQSVAFSVENQPFCILYGDRGMHRGGTCTLQRTYTWELYETRPGCVRNQPSLNCPTIMGTEVWGHYEIVHCGDARVLNMPDMRSCKQACMDDNNCLMMEWYAAKKQDRCFLYSHNKTYDNSPYDRENYTYLFSQPRCNFARNRGKFNVISEKKCIRDLTKRTRAAS